MAHACSNINTISPVLVILECGSDKPIDFAGLRNS